MPTVRHTLCELILCEPHYNHNKDDYYYFGSQYIITSISQIEAMRA